MISPESCSPTDDGPRCKFVDPFRINYTSDTNPVTYRTRVLLLSCRRSGSRIAMGPCKVAMTDVSFPTIFFLAQFQSAIGRERSPSSKLKVVETD